MSNVIIRPAIADDSVALARLAKLTFLDTYAQYNEPRYIQAYVASAFTPAKIGAELQDHDSAFFVAERGATLIGYAKIRRSEPVDNIDYQDAMELERIYVSRDQIGTGIGRMLIDATVDETRRRGARHLWLGVWKNNPEAVAFYRKCGFNIVGGKVFMMGTQPQEDHVMMLTLAAPPNNNSDSVTRA